MERPTNEKLVNVSKLLNSIDEVENYVITDMEGRIHGTPPGDYNESTVNSCIYLWVTGSQFGRKFGMGEPANLIYNLKTRKMLIQKYGDYLIILSLLESVKFPVFKKQLYELFNREILT